MLVPPTEDESEGSERPSEPQTTPSPSHTSEAQVEPQPYPSPRPLPSIPTPDLNPEGSGGNHEGQSSSDKFLSGNKDDLTLQSVYDLYLSLCTQVTNQAAEIKDLKDQVKRLKKQTIPYIRHHKAWIRAIKPKKLNTEAQIRSLSRKPNCYTHTTRGLDDECIHRSKIGREGKEILKETMDAKGVCIQTGEEIPQAKLTVHKDPAFDELDDDAIDYMETEDAQDVGARGQDM
ncbi:hypothetical protein Tco_0873020 [Tanacetum coccineum]